MHLEKIVVAVGFDIASLAAARWVVEHLVPEAEIILTHCIDLPHPTSLLWESLPPRKELEKVSRERAAERLERLARSLPADKVRTAVCLGHPGEEIAKLVAREDADLVAAGRHSSRHGIWHALGSTAEQLILSCRRPVLLGRHPHSAPPENVLVPVDNSDVAARALGWASRLARRYDATVIAHHVVSDWYYHQVREVTSEEKARQAQDGVVEGARGWLTSFVARHALGVPTIEHIGHGQPSFQTLAAIERFHADLVVVGNHGLKSLIGDPLTRLSRFLIMAAPCSLFIVPEDERSRG